MHSRRPNHSRFWERASHRRGRRLSLQELELRVSPTSLMFGGLIGLDASDGGPPELEEGVYIQDGSSPLEVGLMSAPTVIDWDNDGAKDLVVGHFTDGHISVFLNRGSDSAPVFDGESLVQSNGAPITTSFG